MKNINTRTILRLFKENGLYLRRYKDAKFIEFASEEAKLNKGYLRDKFFHVKALANFHDISYRNAKTYFQAAHKTPKNIFKKRRGNLISILGRNSTKKFAFKAKTNSAISEKEKSYIQEQLFNTTTRFNDEITYRSPTTDGKQRSTGPHGTPYELTLSSSNISVMMEKSPARPENSCLQFNEDFDKEFIKDFFANHQADPTFSFTVTKDGIQKRANTKRSCTQKKAAKGYSAAEIFKALGAKFDENKQIHWAHRQGHLMGGKQALENLDPATAGSNYTTLFYIESVISTLLVKENISEVYVSGDISYHDTHKKLPEKITYTCCWGNDLMIKKDIYPLSPRVPTVIENKVAKALATTMTFFKGVQQQETSSNNKDQFIRKINF